MTTPLTPSHGPLMASYIAAWTDRPITSFEPILSFFSPAVSFTDYTAPGIVNLNKTGTAAYLEAFGLDFGIATRALHWAGDTAVWEMDLEIPLAEDGEYGNKGEYGKMKGVSVLEWRGEKITVVRDYGCWVKKEGEKS